ncbi:MAG: hypothetical protein CM15mP18_0370 [Methanobacteriota archaeon]|nr:MAG: hypothetical protein CM15mP18_0370 [Euryarchaeota archaeon]
MGEAQPARGFHGRVGVNVPALLSMLEPFAEDAEGCTMNQEGLMLPMNVSDGDD